MAIEVLEIDRKDMFHDRFDKGFVGFAYLLLFYFSLRGGFVLEQSLN